MSEKKKTIPVRDGNAKSKAEDASNQKPDAADTLSQDNKDNMDDMADMADQEEQSVEAEVSEEPQQPAGEDSDSDETVGAEDAEESEDTKEDKDEIDWQDRCLRTMAEMDNANKTIPKRIKQGVDRFKKAHFAELLELMDGFERAAKHFAETQAAEENEAIKEKSRVMLDGYLSLERILLEVLAKSGVSKIKTKDAKFDPNLHEAITTLPNPEMESGAILDEIRSGWKMDDLLLRASQVVVIKND